MPAFDPHAGLSHDRAFRLMINTPVTLFWRTAILEENVAWLAAHGYQVSRLDAAVFGRRLLCLLHSNDPDISFEPVGRTPVLWNDAEWLDSSRRPG